MKNCQYIYIYVCVSLRKAIYKYFFVIHTTVIAQLWPWHIYVYILHGVELMQVCFVAVKSHIWHGDAVIR